MARIYKYELEIKSGRQERHLPHGAVILSAQMQRDVLCLWAIVEPKAPPQRRLFAVFGTGWDIEPAGLAYIGTVQHDLFVWHVFEATAKGGS